ncbi:M protein repeat protein [Apiospora rasikravindrae]|uniref:M protein repeat protein n=1 Tax=Apiospora rasikravindrae TaxID=990691 RepID=A0ABR1UCY3_9PEZI
MSAPVKSSKWGSFLSQAVANVESRLDNILNEEDGDGKPPSQPPSRPASAASTNKTTATTGKSANDRLQERLARAVAAKNASSTAGSPRSEASPARTQRASLEASSAKQSPRASVDLAGTDAASQAPRSSLSKEDSSTTKNEVEHEKEEDKSQSATQAPNVATTPQESPRPSVQEDRSDGGGTPATFTSHKRNDTVSISVAASEKMVASLDLYEKRISELENRLEETQTQHQEELHSQVEQVDALQAKLQYLARQAAESARKDASSAPGGSPEKKLAEKDQQIAGLLEEGQKLAGNEQKLRAVIKKLRVQVAADEKEANEQKMWRSKTEKELLNLHEALQATDGVKKANDESQKTIAQLKKDMDKLKSTVASKDATITELKSQVQEESERAKSMAAKVNDQIREAGESKMKELEEKVATLEVEKNLLSDRAKTQAAELKEKSERASERARAVEVELRGEVQVLESKLEALRATAEEASSGAVGDAQAKLLRQIETLQTQYSIASENWQGMEASLVARAASLEKERDEAQKRESEMRRKAREVASRAKRQEEELEEAKTKLPSVQKDLSDHQSQIESLRKRAEEAEAALAEAKADFEKQKSSWKEETSDRSGSDRRPWLDEVALRNNNSRPASPLLSATQRTFSTDYLGLQSLSTKFRKPSAPSSNGDPLSIERPLSARRPSHQPPSRPSILSGPPRLTGTPPPMLGEELVRSPTGTPHPGLEREDSFDNLETPVSPHNMMQDVVSVSTAGAGPSVQLVERMSAAVRRLESERVAAKEELARISAQRDEARAEIVTLIKEVESGKTASKKVEDLEKEVTEINERYQTTLEMLGEKSELVEELRADVEDVKAMYRDLVERTIK